MIMSPKDSRAEKLFLGFRVVGLPPDIQRVAMRKLKVLHNAVSLNDLRVPLGNRLEALKGNRGGQHSIRINSQWRICFVWKDGNAHFVEIVDYH
ncbi:type II toxin-antitoxin system RelE/ParE family toxin [Desulfovibrio falkowii]|uniref:type II toxin-antitoxin system RelE/ParE family toxin n=1 Tax=Desulfovibrio falkowii TaxID=3136602 RepID=UPI0038B2BFE5